MRSNTCSEQVRKRTQAIRRHARVGCTEFVRDGGQRSPDVGREGLPLVPLDEAAGSLEPREATVHDGRNGLGALRTRERRRDQLLERHIATRFVQDDRRQLLRTERDQVLARQRRAPRHPCLRVTLASG